MDRIFLDHAKNTAGLIFTHLKKQIRHIEFFISKTRDKVFRKNAFRNEDQTENPSIFDNKAMLLGRADLLIDN